VHPFILFGLRSKRDIKNLASLMLPHNVGNKCFTYIRAEGEVLYN